MCVAYYAAIRRSSHGMNVNCVTTTTAGAGRSARDGIIIHNNTSEDRRYYDQQQQGQGAPSVTSTMRSQATTLPEDRHQLKAKGHYSGTSTVELYFAWFSAITFIGELVIDISLTTFYIQSGHSEWGIITLAIVLVPLVLCQIYSVVLMRSDQHYPKGQSVLPPILWHILLMGLPYRYLHLLKRIDTLPSHEVRYKLQEIQAIQTINAILQYCPQCIFQVFIIMHRNFACLFTGISAGLAGFSFAWHLFLQCYSLAQRNHEDYKITAGPNFTSNLRVNNLENNSSSLATILTSTSSTSIAIHDDHAGAVSYSPSAQEELKKNLKCLEKNSLMDNRNLVSREDKNVDKVKIFQFNNKRRPIGQQQQQQQQQGSDLNFIDRIDRLDESSLEAAAVQNKSTIYYEMTEEEDEEDDLQKKPMANSGVGASDPSAMMPRLKRKGICSSQEMLHLVDLMNENISADQIDKLEQSLLDLNGLGVPSDEDVDDLTAGRRGASVPDEKGTGGGGSLVGGGDGAESGSNHMFKGFHNSLDESDQSSILENIDAAIYENQIIFQERIRKNQLTIQNLKLQDQLLSQFMDLGAHGMLNSSNTNDLQTMLLTLDEQRRRVSEEVAAAAAAEQMNTSMGYLSTRDYENMCFVNIARNVNKMKHWGNYVQNIQSSQHDGSTAMNSSFFANTTATTTTTATNELSEAKVDDLYMVMQPIMQNKNILVETINQINESSPLKQQERPLDGDEFVDDLPGGGGGGGHSSMLKMMRKDSNGKIVPGLYFYNINNVPLDSILESNCEDI